MQRLLPSAFNKLANRPSALLLEVANSDRPCESMQVHHLIPNEIWNNLGREEKEIPFEAFAGGRDDLFPKFLPVGSRVLGVMNAS